MKLFIIIIGAVVVMAILAAGLIVGAYTIAVTFDEWCQGVRKWIE